MAITVKKKAPVTVSVPEKSAEPETPTSEPAITFAPPTFLQRGPSYTPYAVCALIAVLLFAVLLFLQWTEWDGYKGMFPVPTAAKSASTQSAPAGDAGQAASPTTAE